MPSSPAPSAIPYIVVAQQGGWRIRAALETRLHVDFVSGSRELGAATGAEIWVPAHESVVFAARQLANGQSLTAGGLSIEVIAIPGHTPEHLACAVFDDDVPVAVVSGGTLIVGRVARPDLIGTAWTEPLARHAYRSIHHRLFALRRPPRCIPPTAPARSARQAQPTSAFRPSATNEQPAADHRG